MRILETIVPFLVSAKPRSARLSVSELLVTSERASEKRRRLAQIRIAERCKNYLEHKPKMRNSAPPRKSYDLLPAMPAKEDGKLESITHGDTPTDTLPVFGGKIKMVAQKPVQMTAEELAEIQEIKKEMEEQRKKDESAMAQQEQKTTELKPVEQNVPKKKITPQKSPGEFSRFLASLQYIGLKRQGLAFIENIAMMLDAGLPLVDSLKALQMEMRSKGMKKLLQRILDAVENGSAFWRALEATQFFSPHAISLVRIGEEAGNLAKNMQYLAEQQEKDHALRQKVKMAMIYPSIVLTLMFVIVIGLGMFVLPNLISVLFSLNVPLPLVTRLVIMFTNGFTTYGAVGVPSFVGGVIALIILAKFTRLKVVTQWLNFRIPGIGSLAREATIARFGVILGGLLQAGVPLVDALHSLVEVTPIVSYKKFYAKLLEHITVGDSFTKSFSSIHGSEQLLPISVQQLVMTGEKSGSLARIMLKISDIYEKKANETAQKLPVILEPMLLLFIGGLVGTIAFAIIVPIYSVVGNIGR